MRNDQIYLEAFIRYHRWHYYVSLDGGLISDEEFDNVYEQVQRLYPDSPALSEIGATPGVPCPIRPELV